MQKYSNNLVLCFVNGEPYLFNKLLKEYNKLSILPDEAFEIIKKDINFEVDEITTLPKEKIALQGEDLEIFKKLLTLLDNCDDVQNVYHNVDLGE